jgi:hypothetical protein
MYRETLKIVSRDSDEWIVKPTIIHRRSDDIKKCTTRINLFHLFREREREREIITLRIIIILLYYFIMPTDVWPRQIYLVLVLLFFRILTHSCWHSWRVVEAGNRPKTYWETLWMAVSNGWPIFIELMRWLRIIVFVLVLRWTSSWT